MNIGIITGSVRQGRVSHKMAAWITEAVNTQENVMATHIDLKDFELPMMDEPVSPQYNPERKPEGEVKRWLDALAKQDAYIIVTPEYNRSIPGVLKNALDLVAYEMAKKPVGIATHGSSNGAQALAQMRGIIPGLLAVTTPVFLGLAFADMFNFDDEGAYTGSDSADKTALLNDFLADFMWYAAALKK